MSDFLMIRKDLLELVGGGLVEAMLLTQLVSWFQPKAGKSKLKYTKDGAYWLLHSIAQWEDSLCASKRTVIRALDALEEKGFVERQAVFAAGQKTTAIRPVPVPPYAKEVVLSDPDQIAIMALYSGQKQADQSAIMATTKLPLWHFTQTLSYIGIKGFKYKAQNQKKPNLTKQGKQAYTDVENQGVKFVKPEAPKTVEEFLKQQKAKTANTASTPAGLELLWKKMAANETGLFQKPLTGVEKGALKTTIASLGDRAAEALKVALSDWSKFAWQVSKASGL